MIYARWADKWQKDPKENFLFAKILKGRAGKATRFSISLLQRHDDYLFIHDSGCLHLRPQKHISEHWLFIIGTASEALTWKLMIIRVTSRCQSPESITPARGGGNIAVTFTGHHVTNSAAPLSSAPRAGVVHRHFLTLSSLENRHRSHFSDSSSQRKII